MAKVTLRSSDNEVFEVEEAIAFQSEFIKNMVEDTGSASVVIPLSNVTGSILAKVIEYCKFHHAPAPASVPSSSATSTSQEEVIKAFDSDFVKVDQQVLFDLTIAANYLNIQPLLDLTCQAVADIIKEMSPEEIRTRFNIENDFTPEEEEAVRRENQWAFDWH